MIRDRSFLIVCLLLLLAGCESTPVVDETPILSEQNVCECPSSVIEQKCEAMVVEQQPVVKPQPLSCPSTEAAVKKPTQVSLRDDILVIGRVEHVYLPDNLKLKARIDTGIEQSSLQASEIIEFERDSKQWVRFAVLHDGQDVYFERPLKRLSSVRKIDGKSVRQPIVTMSFILGALAEQIDVTLSKHHDHPYPVSIGRNFLRDRALVDVSKKFTAVLPNN